MSHVLSDSELSKHLLIDTNLILTPNIIAQASFPSSFPEGRSRGEGKGGVGVLPSSSRAAWLSPVHRDGGERCADKKRWTLTRVRVRCEAHARRCVRFAPDSRSRAFTKTGSGWGGFLLRVSRATRFPACAFPQWKCRCDRVPCSHQGSSRPSKKQLQRCLREFSTDSYRSSTADLLSFTACPSYPCVLRLTLAIRAFSSLSRHRCRRVTEIQPC